MVGNSIILRLSKRQRLTSKARAMFSNFLGPWRFVSTETDFTSQFPLPFLIFFSFSLFHDPDEGHKEFLVEIFENQSRSYPGGDFKPADPGWCDSVNVLFFSFNLVLCTTKWLSLLNGLFWFSFRAEPLTYKNVVAFCYSCSP